MDSDEIIDLATKRYNVAKDGFQHIYEKAKEDLHFLSDEEFCQWDSREAVSRSKIGRPTLQIDQLTQFIHQVTNDIRMNTPTIKVIPAGSGADVETAEMIEGRIKAIEYKSNADSAYDMAAEFAVKSSIGFIRVDHGYIDDESFDQELRIDRVVNPLSILIDPSSVQPDGSDMKYAFVLEDMTVEEFTEMYPDAEPCSFGETQASRAPEIKDKITIAEYFYIDDSEEERGMLDDGSYEVASKNKKYKQKRKVKNKTIMRCWVSGKDVLEKPSKFPGKYIPIIPVYGEEAWIDGKRNLYSLIRKSKSAQAMYNLWKSLETELLLKQQQAPVQAAVGQMRNFEEDWKNPDKSMVLYYHQTDANGDPAPAPQRLQPPTVPTGIVNAARETVDDIKATMGLYNASIGQRGNETSGIAIQRRQQEGDVATAHFNDNLIRAITHVGKIIVCALPEVEDTARVVQTIGKEDEIKSVGINGAMVEGQERSYDLSSGKWDVRVITGASFTTQRQEAAAYYSDLVGKMPDLMPVIGDLVFKYQDSPGAQAISSRLKKLVDPKLLNESERPQPEENAPNPELQQITQEANQAIQAAQQEIQGLQQQLASMGQEAQTGEMKRAQEAIKQQIATLKQSQRIAELELENQRKDFEIERINALAEIENAMNPPQPEELPPSQQEIDEKMAMDAEAQFIKDQEAEMERKEAEQRAMQANMIAELLFGIKSSLDNLTSSVKQPKQVVFDKNGNPVGIK
jgi:hypothetical protein